MGRGWLGEGWLVTRLLPGSRSQADGGAKVSPTASWASCPRVGEGTEHRSRLGADLFVLDSAEGSVCLHFRVLSPSRSPPPCSPPPRIKRFLFSPHQVDQNRGTRTTWEPGTTAILSTPPHSAKPHLPEHSSTPLPSLSPDAQRPNLDGASLMVFIVY